MKRQVVVAEEAIDRRRGIDYIGVTVTSIIHDGTGRILMMKRGPKARDEQGRWDICGGAVEFGESLDEAVKREVSEELCTVPLAIDFITAYDAHREHGGQPTHWVALLHAVRVDPTTVTIGEPDKISEIQWFNVDNLPKPLHSQFDKALQAAKQNKIIS